MSIQELFQPNSYDIYASSVTTLSAPPSNSFRKGKSNIQSVTPLDPTPHLISFDTYAMPFLYNDAGTYFTFIDDENIRINQTGIYELYGQINTGNETPGSFIVSGFNLQGTILGAAISIAVDDSPYLPFNNGLHSQNTGIILSGIAQLNQNDIIQMQYIVSANSDIYPSSYIGLRFIS